jgi:diguanylate cyclase (GGDEF)-like protein
LQSQATALEHFDHLKLQWEQGQVTSVLFGNALGAIIGNLFNISLVGYLLLQIYPDSWLPIWFGVGLLVNVFRLALYIWYKKKPGQWPSRSWLAIYRATTFVSGVHFGLLAFFFFSSDAPLYQTLVACFICGSVAAAVGTHGVDSITYRLFLFPSAIPLLARAATEGTDIHSALAVMVLFLMFVMLRCANQTQKTMLENIRMSYSLNYRATHDPLVALFNREEFASEFERTRILPVNQDKLISLIFIDLDNFKKVNDTYGHDAGDKALVRISEIIRGSLRKSDIAARFGGDEFMLLLYVDSIDDTAVVCDKILQAISLSDMQFEYPNCELGASLGVGYTSDNAENFKSLFKASDRACYQAKNRGKGQVCFAEVAAADKVVETPRVSVS